MDENSEKSRESMVIWSIWFFSVMQLQFQVSELSTNSHIKS